MAGETSLKEMLSKLLDVRTAKIVTGKVMSTSPLEIKADNDPRLVITESNCFIPAGLTDYDISIKIPGDGTKECTIKGKLKYGDQIYMLSVDRGALYFLLDRVG